MASYKCLRECEVNYGGRIRRIQHGQTVSMGDDISNRHLEPVLDPGETEKAFAKRVKAWEADKTEYQRKLEKGKAMADARKRAKELTDLANARRAQEEERLLEAELAKRHAAEEPPTTSGDSKPQSPSKTP